MVYVLLGILFSVVQIAAAWGYGRFILRLVGLRDGPGRGSDSGCGDAVFAFGIGLVAIGFLVAVAGLAHLLLKMVLGTILAAGCVLGGVDLARRTVRTTETGEGVSPDAPEPAGGESGPTRSVLWRFAPLLGLAPLVVALFFESLVPDYSGDGYLYHLSAPLYYVSEGGFVRQDWAVYYHYPLLVEMLYAPGLAFGLEQAAILLNFWIALACAAVLYRLGARLFGPFGGWTAAFVYLSAPAIVYWTPTSQPETAGTLFLLLSVWALRRWRSERRVGWAVVAGILSAGMTGSKLLYALFAAALLFAIVGAAFWDCGRVGTSVPSKVRGMKTAWGAPLGFAVFLGLAYSPWLVKNALFTGDPFFPVAVDLFPTFAPLRAGVGFLYELHGFPAWEGAAEWGRRAIHGATQLMGEGNTGFVLAMAWVPVAFVLAWGVRRERFLWSILLGVWLVVAHYGGILQVRWFLPAYGLFALVAGDAAARIARARLRPYLRRGVLGFLALLLVLNWIQGYRDRMGGLVGFHRPWTTLTRLGREDFISGLPSYAPAHLVNRLVPADGRVLVAQPSPWHQVRWYRRRFVQNGQDWFAWMVREKMRDEEIAAQLRAEGITHVVALRFRDGGRLAGFLDRYASCVGEARGYGLFELRRGAGESR
ncbi:glycosyltransferase family 39 protein [Candidatus Sumerlaeota bacterium]|nr:glycosyltransferase family 39 protein [Candidatus Sumerlaeota bacterium]